jgi:ferredoxin-NADP reductase
MSTPGVKVGASLTRRSPHTDPTAPASADSHLSTRTTAANLVVSWRYRFRVREYLGTLCPTRLPPARSCSCVNSCGACLDASWYLLLSNRAEPSSRTHSSGGRNAVRRAGAFGVTSPMGWCCKVGALHYTPGGRSRVMIGEHAMVVQAVVREAEDVVSLVLVMQDGSTVPEWQPGAHLDVRLPGCVRSYSLCGEPSDRASWRIAVLRDPRSRGGSAFIHAAVAPGHQLITSSPRNDFPLVECDRYVLIAGGIGITPLLPMVRELAARGLDWRLIYGARRASSMAFTEDLAAFGDRVTLWPEDQRGLIDLDEVLANPAEGTGVFCCGPPALLDAVERRSTAWQSGTLHVERFWNGALAEDGFRPSDGDMPFEVVLAQTGGVVTIPAGTSILEALEERGVEVDASCRQGQCGTCETTVLEGVPDHRDTLLNDDAHQSGATVLICVSRSLTPRLVLDL